MLGRVLKRGAENGRPEASFPSSLPSRSSTPPLPSRVRSFVRWRGRSRSTRSPRRYSLLCVRVCLARRKMSPISLSSSLVACIGSVVWRTCSLSPSLSLSLPFSLSLPLSFRHSFHKFIAQQIACEVSDAQEQKEATDPQGPQPNRRWSLSLSERASGRRQTTRQIDLKYCITHAPQTSNFTMMLRCVSPPTFTVDPLYPYCSSQSKKGAV